MIWSLFLCYFVTTIVANEENSRSANFIIRQNKHLASKAVLKIHPSSLVSCNQACLRHSWCTSTNFKESFGEDSKGSCELNKQELSTIQHNAKLTDQPGNTFTMILEVACRSYPCKNNGTCQSGFTEKGYRCLCPAGWMGTNCEDDIDECNQNIHQCNKNAACNNTKGSYSCTCNTGFHGDGYNCTDIDECDENIHQCNKNAACNNTKGSYSCTCNTGFHGDGYNCTDKCQEIRCGTNATCTNTKGSLRCTCNTGFYGGGYNCTECYTIFDFEDHNLSKWTLTGTAFINQPTYGNIPSAQRGGHFSNHKGDWWIGTFENRPSPSYPVGRYQYDSPQGSMTSPGFSITGKFLRFLIGGGCDPSFQDLRAELIIEGQVVLVQTAKRCAEAMTEKSWDVTSYVGKHAQLRLIDHSSGVWGHLNFDHFQACHKLI